MAVISKILQYLTSLQFHNVTCIFILETSGLKKREEGFKHLKNTFSALCVIFMYSYTVYMYIMFHCHVNLYYIATAQVQMLLGNINSSFIFG